MTWTKLDDNIFQHPKMVRAGEDAANLYVRALVYCNRYLTDGRIEDGVLCAITTRRDAAKLAERLVAVGAWKVHPDGGWTVHNFHEHNPTAEEVIAKRAEVAEKRAKAGKLGGQRSGESRSNEAKRKQREAMESKQNEASDGEATKQNRSPVPSAPLPSGDASHLLSPAPPEAQTTEAPKAPPPNPGETGALFVDPATKAPPPPTKPAPKRRAPSKPKTDDPPPFSIEAAIDAIARAAGPRFEVGDKAAWDPGHIIATRKMIRRFPDLSTWTLVGEWLRAGGDAFRGPVTIEWTAEAHFSTAVMLAKRWHTDGRPAITRNGAAPEPTPEQRRAALVAGADQRPTSTECREPPPRDYDPTAPEVLTEAEIARREYARTAGRAALAALRNPAAKAVNS